VVDGPCGCADFAFKEVFGKTFSVQIKFHIFMAFADRTNHGISFRGEKQRYDYFNFIIGEVLVKAMKKQRSPIFALLSVNQLYSN
jgi:hypothetical protein